VSDIRILGAKRTRKSFLESALAPILNSGRPQTFSELLNAVQDSSIILGKHDLFSTLSVELDRALSPLSGDNDIDVILHVKERGRVQLRTGTDLGNAEGSAYANLNLRNILGGAESLSANFATGTRTRNAYELLFTRPLNGRSPDSIIELAAYNYKRDNSFYASHEQILHGGHAKYSTGSRLGRHEIQYSLQHRQITNLSPSASPTVRASAGNFLLSSLRHTITRDTRDDSLLPSRGYLGRTSQELAGFPFLGGDVSFVKVAGDFQHITPLAQRTAMTVGLRGGLLCSTSRDQLTSLADRFQLGGPTDVRGFRINGLGPRDGVDSVGGDAFIAASAGLLLPIPGVNKDWPLRFQTFVNSGSLLAFKRGQSTPSLFRDLCGAPSIAAGVGIMYRHPVARIELNFTLPIAARENDRTRKGLQFGLGIEFM